jgi:hypothetical protein
MSNSQPGKDTIYIDVDDEITAIIDKVRSSHEKIVALVLPKRATVFQSIVNMKLLKRTADEAKKHLVLITGEAGLLPLAGSVGIYVAKTLQSRPEVPGGPGSAAQNGDEAEEAVDMADTDEDKLDPTRAVGSYAAGAAVSPDSDDDAPIELDNAAPAAIAGGAGKKAKKGKKGGSKFAIPDFNKFRIWIIIGGAGLVALILIWYFGFVVMPRATITVKTNSTAVKASFDLKLDTEADQVDVDSDVIPATTQQTQKTALQQVDATGQKDKGAKATGTIRFYNCNLNDLIIGNDITIPAGTGVTANGMTFITQTSVTVPPSNYQGDACKKNKFSNTVGMTAQNVGDKYNMGATDYSVANNSNVMGQGGTTSGGTTEIVKIVSQADIDSASQKISSQDTSAVKSELTKALQSQNLFVIDATFNAGKPEVSASAKVGDEVPNVTISQKTTYSMTGTKQEYLKKLVENAVSDQIDTSKQTILDFGLTDAIYKMQSQQGSRTMLAFDGTAIAGSDLNLTEIKKQIAGKKANTVKEIIGQYPGVTDVKVDYSPFWVKSIPKKESKITVTVEKPVLGDNAKQQ